MLKVNISDIEHIIIKKLNKDENVHRFSMREREKQRETKLMA